MKKLEIFLGFSLALIISFGFLIIQTQTHKTIGQTSTSSSSSGSSSEASSSSGSGTESTKLNPNFTGVWKASIQSEKPSTSIGSNIITFKLCVRDDKLEGTVQEGGSIVKGEIISQTVVSSNEVTIHLENEEEATITLKLTGEREFIGTFADGHTFKGRKLNLFRACLASGVDVSSTDSIEVEGHGSGRGGGGSGGGGSGMGGSGMGGSGMGGSGMGGSGMGGSGMDGSGMGGSGMGGSGMGGSGMDGSGMGGSGMGGSGMGTSPDGMSDQPTDGMGTPTGSSSGNPPPDGMGIPTDSSSGNPPPDGMGTPTDSSSGNPPPPGGTPTMT